jgi:hypothetical protein
VISTRSISMHYGVEKLVEIFWAARHVTRFGVTENLYGYKEIEKFRKGRPAVNLAREVTRLNIVSLVKTLPALRWSSSAARSTVAKARPGFDFRKDGASFQRMFPLCGPYELNAHTAHGWQLQTIIFH